MEQKRIKSQRHLYLHRPPKKEKEDAWKGFRLALIGFIVIVVLRLIEAIVR